MKAIDWEEVEKNLTEQTIRKLRDAAAPERPLCGIILYATDPLLNGLEVHLNGLFDYSVIEGTKVASGPDLDQLKLSCGTPKKYVTALKKFSLTSKLHASVVQDAPTLLGDCPLSVDDSLTDLHQKLANFGELCQNGALSEYLVSALLINIVRRVFGGIKNDSLTDPFLLVVELETGLTFAAVLEKRWCTGSALLEYRDDVWSKELPTELPELVKKFRRSRSDEAASKLRDAIASHGMAAWDHVGEFLPYIRCKRWETSYAAAISKIAEHEPANILTLGDWLLENQDVAVKQFAVALVGRSPETRETEEGINFLTSILQSHPEEKVRKEAADYLSNIKSPSPIINLALISALADISEIVRKVATITLGRRGGGGSHGVDGLVRLFSDTSSEVRWAALNALPKEVVNKPEVYIEIEKLIGDDSKLVRDRALSLQSKVAV